MGTNKEVLVINKGEHEERVTNRVGLPEKSRWKLSLIPIFLLSKETEGRTQMSEEHTSAQSPERPSVL